MGLHMASIYCPDCNRQAGDNWTECYFCGGKNLKEGEPSPVTSIPKTETTDDVEVSIERVRQLLNKSKFGKVELTKSEKDELSIGFIHYDELSAVEKVKIDREMDEEATEGDNGYRDDWGPYWSSKSLIGKLKFIFICVFGIVLFAFVLGGIEVLFE